MNKVIWIALVPLIILPVHGAFPAGKSARAEFSNDVFFQSDDQFTNGISFILSSSPKHSLEMTEGTPAFGRSLLGWALPEDKSLAYRESWGVGQNVQTPNNISAGDLILDDVPYIGMLGWQNTFYGFDDKDFWAVQWLLGWVGEPALGEEGQKATHEIFNAVDPEGWDNQLDFEPLLNAYFTRKHRLIDHNWYDMTITGDVAIGNFFTFVQPGLAFRFGDRPEGFIFLPDPLGRGIDYDAVLSPGRHFYGSLTFRVTHFFWALPREGNLLVSNTWTDENIIDVERDVAQAIFGLHWQSRNWGAHLTLWLSTKTVTESRLDDGTDANNNFGSIMLERRF
ncbi:MAG: lipid A deacylase LpxR family protein [Oleiphilaceae bacterium]|nr:lipid A deacylase LpxR family protein [Oleiphilaceae bacterium]